MPPTKAHIQRLKDIYQLAQQPKLQEPNPSDIDWVGWNYWRSYDPNDYAPYRTNYLSGLKVYLIEIFFDDRLKTNTDQSLVRYTTGIRCGRDDFINSLIDQNLDHYAAYIIKDTV